MIAVDASSSPSRGFYFSTANQQLTRDITFNGLRPLLGVSIFLHSIYFIYLKSLFESSSPSRGFYFSTRINETRTVDTHLSSSPSRGFYFSTATRINETKVVDSLRPLLGVSIFLRNFSFVKDVQLFVFVPFSGFLFFYITKNCERVSQRPVFVPFSGFLFFYPFPYTPYKYWGFYLACGVNAQTRYFY